MLQLLYFSADWCGPCRNMVPIIKEFALTHPVKKIDVEEQRDVADEYGIQAVPTFIIADEDGNVLVEWHGACTMAELEEQWGMCIE